MEEREGIKVKIILVMAVIGIVVLSTMVHELIHYKQLSDVNANITEVCFMGLRKVNESLIGENDSIFNYGSGWVFAYTDQPYQDDEIVPYIGSAIVVILFWVVVLL